MQASDKQLLVVDDDLFICRYIEDVAAEEGLVAHCTATATEFLRAFEERQPDILMVDLMLPGTDGVELLQKVAGYGRKVSVILISGLDTRNLEAAERVGLEAGLNMCGFLEKPFSPKTLRTTLSRFKESEIDSGELRRGIADGELRPDYQPKIDLATGRVVGVEALVRWHHPTHGVLPPKLFVPMAEHSDLICELTHSVARSSLSQLALWRSNGLPDLHLSINIAARELRSLDSPDHWIQMLDETGVPPSALVLEVTESEAMWSTVSTSEVLTRMRLQGLQLSIDDFGTGFSSLVLLHKLPFSEIKIDRTFTKELRVNRDAKVIVRSIIELGHGLGLSVTAEGIEDPETAQALVELGCDTGQGYHFARPMAVPEFDAWLQKREAAHIDAATG